MAFFGRLLERDFWNKEDWQSQLAPNFLLFPIFYLIFGSNFHQIGSIGTNFGMKLAWLKLKIVPTGATLDILLYLGIQTVVALGARAIFHYVST